MTRDLIPNLLQNLEQKLDMRFNITLDGDRISIASCSEKEESGLEGYILMGCPFQGNRSYTDAGPEMVEEYLELFYSRIEVCDGPNESLNTEPQMHLYFRRRGSLDHDEFKIYAPINRDSANLYGRVFGEDNFYACITHETQLCDTFEYLVALRDVCLGEKPHEKYMN